MRGVDIHTADIVARARARLAALVRRPRAPALPRLARLMSGRIDPEEAAAYDEAAREAFRVGTTREAPRPVAPAPTAESPVSTSVAAPPTASVSAPTASVAAPRVAWVPAPRASAAAPEAEPAREPAAAKEPARRQAGETAPGSLLRTPPSVTSVADDFFDGLIRRVEGDR